MTIYDDMRNVANERLTEFKQGVVQYIGVTTTAGSTPDEPASSNEDTPVTINATVRSVSTKFVDGTHIIQSDSMITMPNTGDTTPKMSGYFKIDGVRFKIIEIMPVPAAGSPIIWKVIVRR